VLILQLQAMMRNPCITQWDVVTASDVFACNVFIMCSPKAIKHKDLVVSVAKL